MQQLKLNLVQIKDVEVRKVMCMGLNCKILVEKLKTCKI